MSAALLGLLLVTFVAGCAAQTPATLQYDALPGVAIYNYGYLFSWDSPQYSEITFYGRDRQPAYTIQEQRNGFHHIGWAIDSDGVSAGVYEPHQVWEGRIDLLDSSGKPIRTINTGSYIPESVVFAPDHTLWTAGYNAGNDGTKGDFDVLHHYARTGKELGETLPWSQINGDTNSYTALQGILGGRWMYAGDDRIGLQAFLNHGFDSWIEVSYSGVLLGKYIWSRMESVITNPLRGPPAAASTPPFIKTGILTVGHSSTVRRNLGAKSPAIPRAGSSDRTEKISCSPNATSLDRSPVRANGHLADRNADE
jgi:hypothetical protein